MCPRVGDVRARSVLDVGWPVCPAGWSRPAGAGDSRAAAGVGSRRSVTRRTSSAAGAGRLMAGWCTGWSGAIDPVHGAVNPSRARWRDGAQSEEVRSALCTALSTKAGVYGWAVHKGRRSSRNRPTSYSQTPSTHPRCTDRLDPPPDARRVEAVGGVSTACRCGKWDIRAPGNAPAVLREPSRGHSHPACASRGTALMGRPERGIQIRTTRRRTVATWDR